MLNQDSPYFLHSLKLPNKKISHIEKRKEQGMSIPEAIALTLDAAPKAGKAYPGHSVVTERKNII